MSINDGYRLHDPLSDLVSLDVYCVVGLYLLFLSQLGSDDAPPHVEGAGSWEIILCSGPHQINLMFHGFSGSYFCRMPKKIYQLVVQVRGQNSHVI